MKLRRGLALFLLAVLALSLFAPAVLAHGHDHLHCMQANCSACVAIRAGAALLRFLSLALFALTLTHAPALSAAAHVFGESRAARHITPVSLKVKMTN